MTCRSGANCAQRLSASSNSSPKSSIVTSPFLRCSTPFGIFEFITTRSSVKAQAGICAQRLSASSNSSLPRCLRSLFPFPCAQRLSASSNSSLGAMRPAIQRRKVLNAFRHLRIHHSSFPICSSGIPRPCSTPFGIFEFITRRLTSTQSIRGRCAQRLSASSNSSLARTSRVNRRTFRCSTPFGIFEFITRQFQCFLSLLLGAQRLSASSNSSLQLSLLDEVKHLVLNAFRHLRIHHFAAEKAGWKAVGCSTPFGIFEFITRRSISTAALLYRVLNAFRHLRIHHRVGKQNSLQLLYVLNAFRHLRIHHVCRQL